MEELINKIQSHRSFSVVIKEMRSLDTLIAIGALRLKRLVLVLGCMGEVVKGLVAKGLSP